MYFASKIQSRSILVATLIMWRSNLQTQHWIDYMGEPDEQNQISGTIYLMFNCKCQSITDSCSNLHSHTQNSSHKSGFPENYLNDGILHQSLDLDVFRIVMSSLDPTLEHFNLPWNWEILTYGIVNVKINIFQKSIYPDGGITRHMNLIISDTKQNDLNVVDFEGKTSQGRIHKFPQYLNSRIPPKPCWMIENPSATSKGESTHVVVNSTNKHLECDYLNEQLLWKCTLANEKTLLHNLYKISQKYLKNFWGSDANGLSRAFGLVSTDTFWTDTSSW